MNKEEIKKEVSHWITVAQRALEMSESANDDQGVMYQKGYIQAMREVLVILEDD